MNELVEDVSELTEEDRIEFAIGRISCSLGVFRVSGESHADFLERLADQAEKDLGQRLTPMLGISEAR